MWCWRGNLPVSWNSRFTNDKVLNRLKEKRGILKIVNCVANSCDGQLFFILVHLNVWMRKVGGNVKLGQAEWELLYDISDEQSGCHWKRKYCFSLSFQNHRPTSECALLSFWIIILSFQIHADLSSLLNLEQAVVCVRCIRHVTLSLIVQLHI